jgi:hypothetical protein
MGQLLRTPGCVPAGSLPPALEAQSAAIGHALYDVERRLFAVQTTTGRPPRQGPHLVPHSRRPTR